MKAAGTGDQEEPQETKGMDWLLKGIPNWSWVGGKSCSLGDSYGGLKSKQGQFFHGSGWNHLVQEGAGGQVVAVYFGAAPQEHSVGCSMKEEKT